MNTNLVLLTPLGALLTLACVLPVIAVVLVARRARRTRGLLGLVEPSSRQLVSAIGSVVAAGGLLGLAATQPVIERTVDVRSRTDAEVFVVLDSTRSMLARQDPGSPMRIERAKEAAQTLRASLAGVPVGVASMTDRVLPHLFPSEDEQVFEATVERSVGIERPPPRSSVLTTVTSLDSLGAIRTQRYFSPKARKRLLVVLTDGETEPVASARLAALFGRSPRIEAVFVHHWRDGERVYSDQGLERQYRPDPSARALLDNVADAVGGRTFDEDDLGSAARAADEALGRGPEVVRTKLRSEVPLAPYLAVATFVPVLLLLIRRER